MTSKNTSAPAPPVAGPSEYERETREMVLKLFGIVQSISEILAASARSSDPIDIDIDPVEDAMREFRRGQRKRRKASGGPR